MSFVAGLVAAMQFLTRIPISVQEPLPHARIVPWFPVAGAIIGAIVGSAAAVSSTIVNLTLAAAIGIVTGLLITGAFHEDGLSDMADAFGGGWTTEQRLAILKDSRHGTYAVAAMVSSILLRVLALAAVGNTAAMFGASVAVHTLARGAAVGAMLVYPPAVDSGLGAGSAANLRPVPTWIGLLVGLAIAAVALGWWLGPAVLAAAVAMIAVGTLAVRKVGGITGDVLGAVEQIAECLILITLAALAGRSRLWWA